MLQLGPQFPIEKKNSKNVSENGSPTRKKPKTCEIAYPSTIMPVAIDNVMNGNFKTQLCSKFRFGHCRYGNKCFFAHGNHEVRHCLPNLQLQRPIVIENGLGRVWNGVNRMANLSNVCKMFYFRQECTYGDKCKFLHGVPDNSMKRGSGYCRENSSISIKSRGISGDNRSGFASLKPVIKKYRLCNKWKMTGSCPYGKMCCFAHGFAELEKPAGHIELVSGFLPAKTPNILLPRGKDMTQKVSGGINVDLT
eukprot:XP_015573750.1 zinc finger CCCH domain-containing protein 56 [Ricinus communis]